MGEIVNLRRVKKARARAAEEQAAAGNRAKHGRTKAEKAAERLEKARAEARAEGARLEE